MKSLVKSTLNQIGITTLKKNNYDSYQMCLRDTENLLHLFVLSQINLDGKLDFIQIGANDGVSDDTFHHLVKKYCLSGVLVEPQSRAFQKLKLTYENTPNINFENAAISDNAGEVTLFTFDRLEEKTHQLDVFTSFNRSVLEKYKKALKLEAKIQTTKVTALTLEDLLDKYSMHNAAILIIDTEGYDFEIIKQIDFEKYRPRIIQFEHLNFTAHTRFTCYQYLTSKGYKLYQDSKDVIAMLPISESIYTPDINNRC